MTGALRPTLAILAACALAGSGRAQQAAPKKAQQIVFAEIASHAVDDAPFPLMAHATSKLAVSYVVVDGPAVLDGKSTLRLTGQPGLVVIRASQAGNGVFAAAAEAERAFSVTSTPVAPKFVVQPSDTRASVGGILILYASATGEPKPAYQWRRNGIEIAGATEARLTIASATSAEAGTYDVRASNSLGSATSARARVVVGKRSQFIVFSQVTAPMSGQTINLIATASSGLPVKFEVVSGSANLNGPALTVMSGMIMVQASQPGDDSYEAAQPVTQTVVVRPLN